MSDSKTTLMQIETKSQCQRQRKELISHGHEIISWWPQHICLTPLHYESWPRVILINTKCGPSSSVHMGERDIQMSSLRSRDTSSDRCIPPPHCLTLRWLTVIMWLGFSVEHRDHRPLCIFITKTPRSAICCTTSETFDQALITPNRRTRAIILVLFSV